MTITPDTVPPSLVLDATDRCDRCIAPALVATAHAAGVLLWCGHHYRTHEVLLGVSGADVVADARTSENSLTTH